MSRIGRSWEKLRDWRRRGAKRYEENLRKRVREGRGMKGLGRSGKASLKRRKQPTTGFRLWVRATKRCAIAVCRKPFPDPHHDPARGMGRSADPWSDDERAVIPLCPGPGGHHQEVHAKGPAHVQDEHEVDFDRIKNETWDEWMGLPPEIRAKWEGRAYRLNTKRGAKPARRPR